MIPVITVELVTADREGRPGEQRARETERELLLSLLVLQLPLPALLLLPQEMLQFSVFLAFQALLPSLLALPG